MTINEFYNSIERTKVLEKEIIEHFEKHEFELDESVAALCTILLHCAEFAGIDPEDLRQVLLNMLEIYRKYYNPQDDEDEE